MLSTVIFILVLSVLIVVHEFGHFIMAKRCGVKVESFSLGFGPKIIGITKGDTEYKISAVPLGGYVKLAGETHQDKVTGSEWEFMSKSVWQRFKIVIFGPVLNYILGFLLFSIVFMMGAPTLTNEVGGVLDDFPAKAAGIREGDRIISIDGEDIEYWNELTEIVHKKKEGEIDLILLRGNKEMNLKVKPKIKEYKDIFGKEVKIALMGIKPSAELAFIKYGPLESVKKGFTKIVELTALTFKALWNLIIGRLSLKESVTGPVGIFMLTTQAARMGLVYLLNIMAVISTSLAIFNVLPIPVLDGGHILFLFIEKMRGRPLSPKVQEIAIQVGLWLLIILMLSVLYFDIIRLFKK